MVVRKLDEHGREVWHYSAVVLDQRPFCIQIEARFGRDDLDLGYVTFKKGDRFVEYFYSDRWYNIFAVYDRDDEQLKGWYCNICRPAHWDAHSISCEDLALDLWVTPDGSTLVMDEEEFAALGISAAERQEAQEALSELLAMAQRGKLPR